MHTVCQNHLSLLMQLVSEFSDFLRLSGYDEVTMSEKIIRDRMVVVYLGLDQLSKQYQTIQSTIEHLTNNKEDPEFDSKLELTKVIID